MVRILLSFAVALVGCTPSPQEKVMNSPSPDPASPRIASQTDSKDHASEAPDPTGAGAAERNRAALGPIPEPVSAAANPLPAGPADSPVEAEGRRILSTAFVRVGPDGHLTVELRNGRVLVLRNVDVRRKDYCGEQVFPGPGGARYCGGYAEIAAARPGGGPTR